MNPRKTPTGGQRRVRSTRKVTPNTTAYDRIDKLLRQEGDYQHSTDQGRRFENLVKFYFQHHPTYKHRVIKAWLWDEYAKMKSLDKDMGIDLMIETEQDGWWAVQAKFFSPTSAVDKKHVDTMISQAGQKEIPDAIKKIFLVSTTDNISEPASKAILNQAILEGHIIQSRDLVAGWILEESYEQKKTIVEVRTPHEHQRQAIEAVVTGLNKDDRGKLIMACGTGKTFTSLRIMEGLLIEPNSKVLFLVPSLSLMRQTLVEWHSFSEKKICSHVVCSDKGIGKDEEDISPSDLPFGATTNFRTLAENIKSISTSREGVQVVFATYHSMDVVADAQKKCGLEKFDMVICDEAHRTAGGRLKTKKEEEQGKKFARIHENDFITANKRLYMTATPIIIDDSKLRRKADEHEVICYSMDDETKFGKEFYCLDFSTAAEKGMLCKHRMIVLGIREEDISAIMQQEWAQGADLDINDRGRLVGCWNGLAKYMENYEDIIDDPEHMKTGVIFARDIDRSEKITKWFRDVVHQYNQALDDVDGGSRLQCPDIEVRHVDGSMSSLQRSQLLDWIKEDNDGCRLLSNARCLTEGVDIPALDAVIFYDKKQSMVDIVQAVGRVMRKPSDPNSNKKYGYIILPVVIPIGSSAEEILASHKNYGVIWSVINALRAHDDTFDADMNQIRLDDDEDELNKKIVVTCVGPRQPSKKKTTKKSKPNQNVTDAAQEEEVEDVVQEMRRGVRKSMASFDIATFKKAMHAKIIRRTTSKEYLARWTENVVQVANTLIFQITSIVKKNKSTERVAFKSFLKSMKSVINNDVTKEVAIEMLAQHVITRPVFETLYKDNKNLAKNPVSIAMNKVLEKLDRNELERETQSLAKFYESVTKHISKLKTADSKQTVLLELYDNFFATAFKRTKDKHGMVYTPIPIVDFILKGTEELMQQEFNQSLSNKGVRIYDPYSGTGVFLSRLLRSEIISDEDLLYKFQNEIFASEIGLLPYYISSVNVEERFYERLNENAGGGLSVVQRHDFHRHVSNV